jgi:hypothetical protein
VQAAGKESNARLRNGGWDEFTKYEHKWGKDLSQAARAKTFLLVLVAREILVTAPPFLAAIKMSADR